MFYIHWTIALIYVLLVVVSIVAVLMDNKQPAKTMAWILVLMFLPLIGFVFYFFFGQNTRRNRMISQRSLDQLSKRSMLEFVEQKDLHIPDRYSTLMHLFANQNLSLPFKDNEVEIYTSGYEFFPALLSAIAGASTTSTSTPTSLKTMPWAVSSPMPSSPRPSRAWRCASSTTMWAVGRCAHGFLKTCAKRASTYMPSCPLGFLRSRARSTIATTASCASSTARRRSLAA